MTCLLTAGWVGRCRELCTDASVPPVHGGLLSLQDFLLAIGKSFKTWAIGSSAVGYVGHWFYTTGCWIPLSCWRIAKASTEMFSPLCGRAPPRLWNCQKPKLMGKMWKEEPCQWKSLVQKTCAENLCRVWFFSIFCYRSTYISNKQKPNTSLEIEKQEPFQLKWQHVAIS